MRNAWVLLVEDDEAMGRLTSASLTRAGFTVTFLRTGAAALELLGVEAIDVVLTDLNMPGMSGLELCRRVTEARPDVPVLVITAFGTMETAIDAMRAGAYDFVTRPLQPEALVFAVDRAAAHRTLRAEVTRLRRRELGAPGRFIGESQPMQRLWATLAQVASSDASVLITGETGTGKELAARRLHELSPRRDGPFIAVNCAAMPEHLLESELFGHAKGAFTDAHAPHTGLFALADKGTLFLDELAELPMTLQPRLLRALQERKVRPLGSSVEVPFDARLVTATNRELELEVEAGRFREDLFFRVNVITLDLPPLRLRGNDVLLLAQHFLERFARSSGKRVVGISVDAAKKLLAYDWPGNVRELQNCMERAVAFASLDHITPGDLPEKLTRGVPSTRTLDDGELVTLAENERRYVARVVAAVGGNKSQAARLLGIDRKSLWRRLAREKPDET